MIDTSSTYNVTYDENRSEIYTNSDVTINITGYSDISTSQYTNLGLESKAEYDYEWKVYKFIK